MSKLHDTRASNCLDLSAMVRRPGNASLEKGCWGQMIRKAPETGPRRWSAMTQWGERSASKGWNSSMLNKHTDLCLGDRIIQLCWINDIVDSRRSIFRPENPCCAIMSTSHREQNIALVREENEPFSLAKCQREKKKKESWRTWDASLQQDSAEFTFVFCWVFWKGISEVPTTVDLFNRFIPETGTADTDRAPRPWRHLWDWILLATSLLPTGLVSWMLYGVLRRKKDWSKRYETIDTTSSAVVPKIGKGRLRSEHEASLSFKS